MGLPPQERLWEPLGIDMSQNFGAFAVAPYIGQPYGQAIKSCTPIDKAYGPRVVRLDIDWLVYGASTANQQIGVNFNLQSQQNPQTGLDAIRSVYIDNTFSPVPVYVQFQDSLQAIVCPAYGTVIAPCFTNLQQGTVFAEGFLTGQVPQTRFHFLNIEKEMAYIPTDPGGAFSNPVVLLYDGTEVASQAGSFNFPSVPIGDADTDRIVVGVLNVSGQSPAANFLNTVGSTFGGVAVTQVAVADSGAFGLSPFQYQRTHIWQAAVPTGTTMAVVISKSGGSTMNMRASFYSLRNLTSPTPIASQVNQGTTQIARTVGIATVANGIVIGGGNGLISTGGAGFTGMSQDNYQSSGLGDFSIAASLLPLSAGVVNVGPAANCRSVAAVSWN